jgi:NDP-sugar pyrophosphorylase family protein
MISTAFVLGAGLGTRLRPLTECRPKPLVPIFDKPLITFAFDHLIASGVQRFVVNTHHCAEAYTALLGMENNAAIYRGLPIQFSHEPVLLETGGGIKRAASFLGQEPFIVYNGDVLADFPLESLMEVHQGSGNIATLALRSEGAERRIQLDQRSGLITDMRGLIGGRMEPAFLFTGISIISSEVLNHIPDGEIVSIIPILLDLLRSGRRVGGVVIDEGDWFDIGNIDSYMEVHSIIASRHQGISYLPEGWPSLIQSGACINPTAKLLGCTIVGEGACIGESARLENVIVWPGENVVAGSTLKNAVICNGRVAQSSCSLECEPA